MYHIELSSARPTTFWRADFHSRVWKSVGPEHLSPKAGGGRLFSTKFRSALRPPFLGHFTFIATQANALTSHTMVWTSSLHSVLHSALSILLPWHWLISYSIWSSWWYTHGSLPLSCWKGMPSSIDLPSRVRNKFALLYFCSFIVEYIGALWGSWGIGDANPIFFIASRSRTSEQVARHVNTFFFIFDISPLPWSSSSTCLVICI